MKIILCRWDIGEIGERPRKYCAKDVLKNQPLPYCQEHLARVPIWPTDEVDTGGEG